VSAKHFWRFDVLLDSGEVIRERGWGIQRAVAAADVRRKLEKLGVEGFDVMRQGGEGPICQHEMPKGVGAVQHDQQVNSARNTP